MENPQEEIQFISSCSTCGGANNDGNAYKNQQRNLQQIQKFAQGSTSISGFNIFLIVLILLLLLGGVFLFRNKKVGRRR